MGDTGPNMMDRLVEGHAGRRTGVFHVHHGRPCKPQAPQDHLTANTVLAGEHPLRAISIEDSADGALITVKTEAGVRHGFPDCLLAQRLVRSGFLQDPGHPHADDKYAQFHMFSCLISFSAKSFVILNGLFKARFDYRFFNDGFLFSIKAVIPSFRSTVAKRISKQRAS